jgi:hypothetical protein
MSAKLSEIMQLCHLITLSDSMLNTPPSTAELFIKIESVMVMSACLSPAVKTAPSPSVLMLVKLQLFISTTASSYTERKLPELVEKLLIFEFFKVTLVFITSPDEEEEPILSFAELKLVNEES